MAVSVVDYMQHGGHVNIKELIAPQSRSSRGRRAHPHSSSRLARPNQLLGRRPVRAQQTIEVEVVWSATTDTITPQATLTDESAALKQALRPPVVDPDEGVYAIDQVLSVNPLKHRGHGLTHQSLAPVSRR